MNLESPLLTSKNIIKRGWIQIRSDLLGDRSEEMSALRPSIGSIVHTLIIISEGETKGFLLRSPFIQRCQNRNTSKNPSVLKEVPNKNDRLPLKLWVEFKRDYVVRRTDII
jgi:hypothetical protein